MQLVDKVRHVESKSNQESLEMVQRVFKASLDDKQMESPSDLLHCGENAAVVQHEGLTISNLLLAIVDVTIFK